MVKLNTKFFRRERRFIEKVLIPLKKRTGKYGNAQYFKG